MPVHELQRPRLYITHSPSETGVTLPPPWRNPSLISSNAVRNARERRTHDPPPSVVLRSKGSIMDNEIVTYLWPLRRTSVEHDQKEEKSISWLLVNDFLREGRK